MIEEMRGSVVLVTVLLGGCVEAHVLPCGDLICPGDELCLEVLAGAALGHVALLRH